MTKRDYTMIASAIAGNDTVRGLVTELCIGFKRDNPRFDVARFIAACAHPGAPTHAPSVPEDLEA